MPEKKDKKPKTDGEKKVKDKKQSVPEEKKSLSPKPAAKEAKPKASKSPLKKEEQKVVASADQVKPKRATSAYLYYNMEMTKKLREQDTNLSQKDAMK